MANVVDTTLFGLVHDFFKIYLPNQRRCSQHTIRSYQTALNSLFSFVQCEKRIGLSEITFEMLDSGMLSKYLDHLEENGCEISTRNHRLNGIRSFYAYATAMEPTVVIYQAEIRKVPKKKPEKQCIVEYMSEAAVKSILNQPDAQTPKGVRDLFLMLLMYDTAARVQEVCNIRLCDIRLAKTPTVILHGKGSKVRTVPLMGQTTEHYSRYVELYHPGTDSYSKRYLFFTMNRGEPAPICDSTIRRTVYRYADMARVSCSEVPAKVHPHLFRHSRAMHLYQHGMDLTLISQWLGHAQLDTTLIYAHADTEQKRIAIEQATPPNSPVKHKLNAERFTIDDEDLLKKLYGLS